MPLYIVIYSNLFLSCWKLILGEFFCFLNKPSVSKHLRGAGGGGQGRQVFQHPPTSKSPPHPPPPLRSAPRFLSAQRHPTVPFINVSSRSPILSVERPWRLVVLPRFAPTPQTITLLPTPPPSMDFRGLKIYLGLIWQQLSKFLPLRQLVIQPQGAMSYLGPDTSKFIVA